MSKAVPDWERLRRLRWGAVKRLIMLRWKTEVPDDEAGRPDLFELMTLASLAPTGADKKMRNALEVWAPWMGAEEAEAYIDHLNNAPISERSRTPRQLGERLHLSNADRERWGGLNPILPFDMTDEELAEQRKKKHRERYARQRIEKGARTREQYLADCAAIATGVSRAKWYRQVRRGVRASIVNKKVQHLVSSSERGMHEVSEFGERRVTQAQAFPGHVNHLVSRKVG